eukprot:m.274309 g.274309  ORF g.274309 m.274309 type:complete len:155 (-) comp17685_c0_seq5:5762-6226(-)
MGESSEAGLPACLEQHFSNLLSTTAAPLTSDHTIRPAPSPSPVTWTAFQRYFTGPSISLNAFVNERRGFPLLATSTALSTSPGQIIPEDELHVDGITFQLYEAASHPDFRRRRSRKRFAGPIGPAAQPTAKKPLERTVQNDDIDDDDDDDGNTR